MFDCQSSENIHLGKCIESFQSSCYTDVHSQLILICTRRYLSNKTDGSVYYQRLKYDPEVSILFWLKIKKCRKHLRVLQIFLNIFLQAKGLSKILTFITS